MTTLSVRPIIEDQTDSPYVDVMYTLEEEEWENVTDYQEGGFGSEGTLSKSSNCSDLASLDATASLGDPEVLAVDYGDHEDYIWVTGKSACVFRLVITVATGFLLFCLCLWGFVTQFILCKTAKYMSLVCFLVVLVFGFQ